MTADEAIRRNAYEREIEEDRDAVVHEIKQETEEFLLARIVGNRPERHNHKPGGAKNNHCRGQAENRRDDRQPPELLVGFQDRGTSIIGHAFRVDQT